MPRALRFLTSRRWAAVIFAFSAAAYLVVRHYTHATSGDLFVYRSEGAALRHGVGVYGQLYGLAGDPPHAHATYPPFAVLLFVPLSWLSEFLYLPEVLYLVILIWLFLSGLGWLSVDRLILF